MNKPKQDPKRATLAQIAEETLEILDRGTYELQTESYQITKQIEEAREHTYVHKNAPTWRPQSHPTQIEVTAESTIEAIIRLQDLHPVALNFASARRPGGGFIKGAQAQEESLARASGLYTCLLSAKSFYQQQTSHSYNDWTVWSPNVPFFRDPADKLCPPFYASILTCAAPNASAMHDSEKAHLPKLLKTRAEILLATAAHHSTKTLILGAWGCGVFQNDPDLVAQTFRAALNGPFQGQFQKVTFAIFAPTGTDPILETFQKILTKCNS